MMKYSSDLTKAEYYSYPTEGFAPGCNLYDVINSFDPFQSLELENFSGSSPYTVKVDHINKIQIYSCIGSSYQFCFLLSGCL